MDEGDRIAPVAGGDRVSLVPTFFQATRLTTLLPLPALISGVPVTTLAAAKVSLPSRVVNEYAP